MPVTSVSNIPISPMSLPTDIRETIRHNDPPPSQHENKNKPLIIHSTAAELQRVFDKKLQFVVDHSSKQVIVKVIDKETDKVIRELPPEELQRLHRNIREAIGLLFDELV